MTGYEEGTLEACDTFSRRPALTARATAGSPLEQRLDLRELPLQRPQVGRDGGVAELRGQGALAAG